MALSLSLSSCHRSPSLPSTDELMTRAPSCCNTLLPVCLLLVWLLLNVLRQRRWPLFLLLPLLLLALKPMLLWLLLLWFRLLLLRLLMLLIQLLLLFLLSTNSSAFCSGVWLGGYSCCNCSFAFWHRGGRCYGPCSWSPCSATVCS